MAGFHNGIGLKTAAMKDVGHDFSILSWCGAMMSIGFHDR